MQESQRRIYRTPNDTISPHLVVREQKLTPHDLHGFVRHAVWVWKSAGNSAGVLQSVAVHRDSIQDFPAPEVPSAYQEILDALPAMRLVEFPGIGKGRTVGVMARKATSARVKP